MNTNNKFYQADFGFDEPFDLPLDTGDIFVAEKVVRLIPARRLVAFGTWQGIEVVAKIFFDKKRAARHIQKEIAGIKALQKNNIPTPKLLAECVSDDKRCQVLIFERLTKAINLYEIWNARQHISKVLVVLHAVITEIATQHVLGLMQQDLHLKNFLITEKEVFNDVERVSHEHVQVYSLDGGEIISTGDILDKKESMQNLALFLSQLGAGVESYQLMLFRYYAKQRGWLIKQKDNVNLLRAIKKCYEERWISYQKKIMRNSTGFARINTFTKLAMYDRHYAKPEFMRFMECPDLLFSNSSVHLLKAGHSSTVVKVTLDGKEFVIKRYNMKSFFHWLRRCLRPTRASLCWHFAQKLTLLFIPTATPVAFIEQRVFGLRGKSYYVTEYIPGENVGEFFKKHQNDKTLTQAMIARVSGLLRSLLSLRMTHGDLKMTNILLDKQYQPILIDLDGMQEHTRGKTLRKSWKKELHRFLRNFDVGSEVRTSFEKELK